MRELLDGGEQALRQPRDVGEQSLVGGFTRGEKDQHFAAGQFEAFGELLDVRRKQRGCARGGEGKTDLGGGEHFGRELSEGVAELGAEGHSAHLPHHRQQRPGGLFGLLGHGFEPRA